MNTYIFKTPVGLKEISAANRIMAYELFEEMYPELVVASDIIEVKRIDN